MEFRQSQRFSKELKRLSNKKARSLGDDFGKLKAVLAALPEGNGSKHWNKLHVSECGRIQIFKVRLACASMKGESRFRVIYAYNKADGLIEYIDFIEIYFKGEKVNEDRGLIEEYKKRLDI